MDSTKTTPMCQSCGMPLKDDSMRGKNKDGTKSEKYCNFCYENGEFKDTNLTLEKQREKLVNMSVKSGMSPEKAKEQGKQLDNLERWNKKA